MPENVNLTRQESENERRDPEGENNRDSNLNGLQTQMLREEKFKNEEVKDYMGKKLEKDQNKKKLETINQKTYENTKTLMNMNQQFINQVGPGMNINQREHGMMNHQNLQMTPMGPGFPIMGFPMYQQNMNEFGYMPQMRFQTKTNTGLDRMSPQAVLGRLCNQQFPQNTFNMNQSSMYVQPNHYSQYFEFKDEEENEFAFLDYSGGVVYDNGAFSNGGRWITFWEYKGRIWRKSFPVKMFGNEGAKELAENFWVSKMRAIQLFNKNKQDTLMKIEKKAETRGRKKRQILASPEITIPQLSLDPNLAAQYIMQDKSIKEKELLNNKLYKDLPNDEMMEIKISREPRIDKTEIEGLDWDEETKTWSFEKVENGEFKRVEVKDENKQEGLKKIKELKEEYEYDLLKEYANSGIKGVVYDKIRMNWKVTHQVPSKNIKRHKVFSVTKLGYKQALETSIEYKKLVDELEGEEPEDFMPEQKTQEELLSDPMVSHYQKVLSSIAVKEVKDSMS